MKSILVLILLTITLFCCKPNKKHQEEILSDENIDSTMIISQDSIETSIIKEPKEVVYEQYELRYSDSLIYSNEKNKIDTALDILKSKDTIFSFLINSLTKKVLRLSRNRGKYNLVLPSKIIPYSPIMGSPSHYVGDQVFFSLFEGNEYGGEIKIMKYQIVNNNLLLKDSIVGGEYGEGWGATYFALNEKGELLGEAIDPNDKYYLDSQYLLLSTLRNRISRNDSMDIILFDHINNDTISKIKVPPRYVINLTCSSTKIFLYVYGRGRKSELKAYSLQGELKWENHTNYLSEILSDETNNFILSSGYWFTGKPEKNSKLYFVACYNSKSGERQWDIPLGSAFDSEFQLGDHISVKNLFNIGNGLYGIIINQYAYLIKNKSVHINRLIIINKRGEIIQKIELLKGTKKYSVINLDPNKFQLIRDAEIWTFKINTP